MEERKIRRGDIYHADLNPVFGSEQGGYWKRYCSENKKN